MGYKFGVISILMIHKTRRLDELTRGVNTDREENRREGKRKKRRDEKNPRTELGGTVTLRDEEDEKEPAKETWKEKPVRNEDNQVGVLPGSQGKEVFEGGVGDDTSQMPL